MPKSIRGPRLGGSPIHECLILCNLATQLLEHSRTITTETEARRVQSPAEKFIIKAKRGDLHSRRLVLKPMTDRDAVAKLFKGIAPTLQDRNGGCTRITKIGIRKDDSAPLTILELATEPVEYRSED